jgi:hypothetical protein
MHQDTALFEDAKNMIDWLSQNNIKSLPRQLDGTGGSDDNQRLYSQNKVQWFNTLYKSKTFGDSPTLLDNVVQESASLTDLGRACCGGRQVCLDQDYKQRHFYIENKFPDWHCSVNHFFLYVKQVNGEIYVNRDCKMNFDGGVGPIGNLNNTDQLLTTLQTQLLENKLPVIQCKKDHCRCGLCAPKAKDLDSYKQIMKKYQKETQ